MANTYTVDEVLKIVKVRIKGSSLRAVAKDMEISPAYLHDLVNKRRAISEAIAEKLGFERIVKTEVVFKKVPGGQDGK